MTRTIEIVNASGRHVIRYEAGEELTVMDMIGAMVGVGVIGSTDAMRLARQARLLGMKRRYICARKLDSNT